jgi:hypothetical protein
MTIFVRYPNPPSPPHSSSAALPLPINLIFLPHPDFHLPNLPSFFEQSLILSLSIIHRLFPLLLSVAFSRLLLPSPVPTFRFRPCHLFSNFTFLSSSSVYPLFFPLWPISHRFCLFHPCFSLTSFHLFRLFTSISSPHPLLPFFYFYTRLHFLGPLEVYGNSVLKSDSSLLHHVKNKRIFPLPIMWFIFNLQREKN